MQNKKTFKTKTWLIIFGIILAASIITSIFLYQKKGTIAVIERDGIELQRIDLSAVTDSYEIPVESEYGKNTILVEHGRIRMSDADCPDKVCVNTGWTSSSGIPVVCLPHHLVVRIEAAPDKSTSDEVDVIVQ